MICLSHRSIYHVQGFRRTIQGPSVLLLKMRVPVFLKISWFQFDKLCLAVLWSIWNVKAGPNPYVNRLSRPPPHMQKGLDIRIGCPKPSLITEGKLWWLKVWISWPESLHKGHRFWILEQAGPNLASSQKVNWHVCVFKPQEGTLIFSYIRRLGSFFGGSKFWFSIFLGVFRKNNIFGGIKNLWIFFWGHHKIGLYLGVISIHFRVFSKVKVQNGGIFGSLKFQISFWGVWNSWYFLGWTVDAGPEPTYAEKMRVPPLGFKQACSGEPRDPHMRNIRTGWLESRLVCRKFWPHMLELAGRTSSYQR